MLFVRTLLLLTTLLCLFGTVAAHAETMVYRVYLGPMLAGKITFESNVTATDYRIEATMKDSMPLVTFDDMMRVQGQVVKGQLVPTLYEQRMNENDYKAHKQVSYGKDGKTARFTNLLDPAEKAQDLKVPNGAADALTTLWRLRGLELAKVEKPIKQQVIGLKRAVDQTITVKGVSQQKIREKNRWRLENLRQVTLSVTDENKPDVNSVWHLYFRENATVPLVPVMFSTQTKYGLFTAYLQE